MPMQATLLNYGGQHGYGRCSIASQGSLEEDECDSSEELIGNASGGGQSSEPHALGAQPKLAPISGSVESTTVFRLQFLGSVEVEEEGGRKRRKRLKNHMVEEAVTKIKVRLALHPETTPSPYIYPSDRLPFESLRKEQPFVPLECFIPLLIYSTPMRDRSVKASRPYRQLDSIILFHSDQDSQQFSMSILRTHPLLL